MGIDWEKMLDADGDDLQDAYDGHIDDVERITEMNSRHDDAASEPATTPAPKRAARPASESSITEPPF